MQNKGIKYGLIAGVMTSFVLLLFYFINPRTMLSAWVINGTLLIYLIGMFTACNVQKKENGGEIPFPQGLKIAFTTYLVSNVVYFVFYYGMFNFIDPSIIEIQREMTADLLEWTYKGDELEERLNMLKTADINVYFKTVLRGFINGAIGGFIWSLMVAGIIERI